MLKELSDYVILVRKMAVHIYARQPAKKYK